jgi:hypothetical protein
MSTRRYDFREFILIYIRPIHFNGFAKVFENVFGYLCFINEECLTRETWLLAFLRSFLSIMLESSHQSVFLLILLVVRGVSISHWLTKLLNNF